MNKTDKIIVALLFCVLIGWSFYGRKNRTVPETMASDPAQTNLVETASPAASASSATAPVAPVAAVPVVEPPPAAEIVHESEEQTSTLSNDKVHLIFSSWGGGVTAAELTQYPETMDAESGPVVFDFSKRPALTYTALPGLSGSNDFKLQNLSEVNGMRISREDASGLSLSRVAMLTNGYSLVVTDSIVNNSDAAITIPETQMNMGPMPNVKTKAKTRGISYLGVDTMSSEKKSRIVMHGKAITSLFGVKGGCSRPDLTAAPLNSLLDVDQPLSWVASKNKFFAQILTPAEGATKCRIYAGRDESSTAFTLTEVSAALSFAEKTLEPGESVERTTTYYVGPQKFSELKALGDGQDRIMLRSWKWFGWWRYACIGLLWLLNGLKAITFNYGIAVILLTIIVKVVFWPVTHKGTESMKRMQKLQPQLTKLR